MSRLDADHPLYKSRRRSNAVVLGLAVIATGTGLFFLGAILATLVYQGISAWTPSLFAARTMATGSDGGLANAILGSIMLTFFGVAIGAPVGILAGTWIAEYSRGSRIGIAVEFVNDVLLSAPSIVVGLFVYQLMVVPMHHFSAWAGSVALAILVVPVVVRTTVDMLRLVPNSLREAAAALGMPKWQSVARVAYRAALQGILTGVMLAVARISGETAPLLFTAFNNQFTSVDMNAPMANLPSVIFQYALSPYDDWQHIAWGGALLITMAILAINIGARSLANLGGQKS